MSEPHSFFGEGYIEGTSTGCTYEASVECPSCLKQVPPHSHHREIDCRRNQIRSERHNFNGRPHGKGLPFFVVSYGISRHYGGPEEGGWWYDVTIINEVDRVFTFKQARDAVRRFREQYPTCPRGRGSVIGGTDEYIKLCYDETEFPSETHGRPHYE